MFEEEANPDFVLKIFTDTNSTTETVSLIMFANTLICASKTFTTITIGEITASQPYAMRCRICIGQ